MTSQKQQHGDKGPNRMEYQKRVDLRSETPTFGANGFFLNADPTALNAFGEPIDMAISLYVDTLPCNW